eukprot:UC4_evm1s564
MAMAAAYIDPDTSEATATIAGNNNVARDESKISSAECDWMGYHTAFRLAHDYVLKMERVQHIMEAARDPSFSTSSSSSPSTQAASSSFSLLRPKGLIKPASDISWPDSHMIDEACSDLEKCVLILRVYAPPTMPFDIARHQESRLGEFWEPLFTQQIVQNYRNLHASLTTEASRAQEEEMRNGKPRSFSQAEQQFWRYRRSKRERAREFFLGPPPPADWKPPANWEGKIGERKNFEFEAKQELHAQYSRYKDVYSLHALTGLDPQDCVVLLHEAIENADIFGGDPRGYYSGTGVLARDNGTSSGPVLLFRALWLYNDSRRMLFDIITKLVSLSPGRKYYRDAGAQPDYENKLDIRLHDLFDDSTDATTKLSWSDLVASVFKDRPDCDICDDYDIHSQMNLVSKVYDNYVGYRSVLAAPPVVTERENQFLETIYRVMENKIRSHASCIACIFSQGVVRAAANTETRNKRIEFAFAGMFKSNKSLRGLTAHMISAKHVVSLICLLLRRCSKFRAIPSPGFLGQAKWVDSHRSYVNESLNFSSCQLIIALLHAYDLSRGGIPFSRDDDNDDFEEEIWQYPEINAVMGGTPEDITGARHPDDIASMACRREITQGLIEKLNVLNGKLESDNSGIGCSVRVPEEVKAEWGEAFYSIEVVLDYYFAAVLKLDPGSQNNSSRGLIAQTMQLDENRDEFQFQKLSFNTQEKLAPREAIMILHLKELIRFSQHTRMGHHEMFYYAHSHEDASHIFDFLKTYMLCDSRSDFMLDIAPRPSLKAQRIDEFTDRIFFSRRREVFLDGTSGFPCTEEEMCRMRDGEEFCQWTPSANFLDADAFHRFIINYLMFNSEIITLKLVTRRAQFKKFTKSVLNFLFVFYSMSWIPRKTRSLKNEGEEVHKFDELAGLEDSYLYLLAGTLSKDFWTSDYQDKGEDLVVPFLNVLTALAGPSDFENNNEPPNIDGRNSGASRVFDWLMANQPIRFVDSAIKPLEYIVSQFDAFINFFTSIPIPQATRSECTQMIALANLIEQIVANFVTVYHNPSAMGQPGIPLDSVELRILANICDPLSHGENAMRSGLQVSNQLSIISKLFNLFCSPLPSPVKGSVLKALASFITSKLSAYEIIYTYLGDGRPSLIEAVKRDVENQEMNEKSYPELRGFLKVLLAVFEQTGGAYPPQQYSSKCDYEPFLYFLVDDVLLKFDDTDGGLSYNYSHEKWLIVEYVLKIFVVILRQYAHDCPKPDDWNTMDTSCNPPRRRSLHSGWLLTRILLGDHNYALSKILRLLQLDEAISMLPLERLRVRVTELALIIVELLFEIEDGPLPGIYSNRCFEAGKFPRNSFIEMSRANKYPPYRSNFSRIGDADMQSIGIHMMSSNPKSNKYDHILNIIRLLKEFYLEHYRGRLGSSAQMQRLQLMSTKVLWRLLFVRATPTSLAEAVHEYSETRRQKLLLMNIFIFHLTDFLHDLYHGNIGIYSILQPGAQTEPYCDVTSWKHNSVEQAICCSLLHWLRTCIEMGPGLAHKLLLGWEWDSVSESLGRIESHVLERPLNCLHALIDMEYDRKTSENNRISQRDPILAEQCLRLIFTLCCDKTTLDRRDIFESNLYGRRKGTVGDQTIKFLGNMGEGRNFFSLVALSLGDIQEKLINMSLKDIKYPSGKISLASSLSSGIRNDAIIRLHYRSSLMNFQAYQLKIIALKLLADARESGSSSLLCSILFEQRDGKMMKMLEILDGIPFVMPEIDPPTYLTREDIGSNPPIITQQKMEELCNRYMEKHTEGGLEYREVLTTELFYAMKALAQDEVKDLKRRVDPYNEMMKEMEDILNFVMRWNAFQREAHVREHLFQAWHQVLLIALHDFPHCLMNGQTGTNVLNKNQQIQRILDLTWSFLDLLLCSKLMPARDDDGNILVDTFSSVYRRMPVMASATVMSLMKALHEFRVSADMPVLSNERLKKLFICLVQVLMKPGSNEQTRENYYTAFMYYMQYVKSLKTSTTNLENLHLIWKQQLPWEALIITICEDACQDEFKRGKITAFCMLKAMVAIDNDLTLQLPNDFYSIITGNHYLQRYLDEIYEYSVEHINYVDGKSGRLPWYVPLILKAQIALLIEVATKDQVDRDTRMHQLLESRALRTFIRVGQDGQVLENEHFLSCRPHVLKNEDSMERYRSLAIPMLRFIICVMQEAQGSTTELALLYGVLDIVKAHAKKLFLPVIDSFSGHPTTSELQELMLVLGILRELGPHWHRRETLHRLGSLRSQLGTSVKNFIEHARLASWLPEESEMTDLVKYHFTAVQNAWAFLRYAMGNLRDDHKTRGARHQAKFYKIFELTFADAETVGVGPTLGTVINCIRTSCSEYDRTYRKIVEYKKGEENPFDVPQELLKLVFKDRFNEIQTLDGENKRN